jgi:hypothetical protein
MLHDIELNCSEIAETIEGRATPTGASALGQKRTHALPTNLILI